jgi:hypothetical protein
MEISTDIKSIVEVWLVVKAARGFLGAINV